MLWLNLSATTTFCEIIDPKPKCIYMFEFLNIAYNILTIKGVAYNKYSFLLSLDTVPQSKSV